MANKDFERMIQLGGWLEKYLNPNINLQEYRKLAKEFIYLYNIDHGITKNEITFKIIELVESQEKEIRDFYRTGYSSLDYVNLPAIESNTDPLKLKEAIEKMAVQLSNNEDDKASFITPIFLDMLSVYKYKEFIQHVFRWISKTQDPWEITLIDQRRKEAWLQTIDESGEIIEEIAPQRPLIIRKMEEHYAEIHTTVSIHQIDQTISLVKSFDQKGHSFSNEFVQKYPDHEESSLFPWQIVASRAFFDFLFLGGQEYFLFCKYCGKFTLIRRKGRKKFCSDICRTNYGREKNAASI